jgi:hypothetical protein
LRADGADFTLGVGLARVQVVTVQFDQRCDCTQPGDATSIPGCLKRRWGLFGTCGRASDSSGPVDGDLTYSKEQVTVPRPLIVAST